MTEALVSAGAALLGAAVGAYATFRASGPYWERLKLSAEPGLIQTRISLYGSLWELTEYGPPEHPKDLNDDEKNELNEALRTWFYKDGAGLLLSDAARVQWEAVTRLLGSLGAKPEEIRQAMSCLRTRLKQDIHVHGPRIDESKCQEQPGWKEASNRRDSKG